MGRLSALKGIGKAYLCQASTPGRNMRERAVGWLLFVAKQLSLYPTHQREERCTYR